MANTQNPPSQYQTQNDETTKHNTGFLPGGFNPFEKY